MRAGVYLWVHLAALPVGAAVLPLSDSTTEVPVAPIAVLTGRPAEEVERQPRVRVAGQVTMVDPLVVQDASGGVFVNEWSQPRATASWPVVDDLVEVVGTLSAGGFTPAAHPGTAATAAAPSEPVSILRLVGVIGCRATGISLRRPAV